MTNEKPPRGTAIPTGAQQRIQGDYSMNNEKLLNKKLDDIRAKADALKGLYSLRTLLIDIKRRDLSEQGTRAFFDVLTNELGRYAVIASDIWWLTNERLCEAEEMEEEVTEDDLALK
jgi:hypothetical protein